MAKFHINAAGNPGICRAVNGRCPFGGEENHFDSAEQAQAAFETRMSDQAFTSTSKRASAPAPGSASFDAMRDWDDSFKRAEAQVTLRKTAAISAGIKSQLMEKYYGAGSYAKTISNARERAGMATQYFEQKSKDKSGSFLEANSSVAAPEVASRTLAAVGAARAEGSVDSSRTLAFATPASGASADKALAALAARKSSAATSPIGAAAGSFVW